MFSSKTQLLAFLSFFISSYERDKIKSYGNQPLKHQPVFIIGAPRTGSTIVYQALTNLYDVLYIDNLVCKFCRNLFFGFRLDYKIFKDKPHDNYEADHGNTGRYGLHAPSECGGFWYRWLPRDHHFIGNDEITDAMVVQIRREIAAVINYFDKPLVFKNLNAGQRIRLLARCFPEARFVFITRDPLYTAQSILGAKRRIGIADDCFWSVMPKNVDRLKKLDPYAQIANQVYSIEKQIYQDRSMIRPGHFFQLNYNELSIDEIMRLGQSLGFSRRPGKAKTPVLATTETQRLPDTEFVQLKQEINKLSWNFESQ